MSQISNHDYDVILEALRFFVWAAGQGISPIEGEPASSPEDVLYEYSLQTGYEDWDYLPHFIIQKL